MIPDDEGARPPPSLTAFSLDRLGIAELQNHIATLRAEIAKAEAEIARKERLRSAADSVFRS